MMVQILLWWCTLWVVHCSVLDPALFLSPSPPLTPSSDDASPEERWSAHLDTRVEREAVDLLVVPLEKDAMQTESPETMENAETFWPSLRPTSYGIRSLHVPLTFAISGSYGGYGINRPGLIGSNYGSTADGLGLYGKTGFAGSGYGAYGPLSQGTRVYGGSTGLGWSGWGNGKWGHYGKG